MKRELKSAIVIRDEVVRLIHADREVQEDAAEIGIGLPLEHETDRTGCNWDIQYSQNSSGHLGVLRSTIENVRRRWNLTT